jgi:hypothetical protein
MISESAYDQIILYPPAAGMNQDISDAILDERKYCYYLLNMITDKVGESKVRFGTHLTFDQNDTNYQIINEFLYRTATGSRQTIRYGQVYKPLPNNSINLSIPDVNHITVTNQDASNIVPDTYIALNYSTPNGLSPTAYYFVISVQTEDNHLLIELGNNSFSDDLEDFFIQQQAETIEYVSHSSIRFSIPEGFDFNLFYRVNQAIKLIVNDVIHDLTINSITENNGFLDLVFNENTVPEFTGVDTVSLRYQSSTPELVSISYPSGVLDVYDHATNSVLPGNNQKIENLSASCTPRGDFIDGKFWICNGVNKIMTWDGTNLAVYVEYVKEFAQTFNRIDNTHFSFTSNPVFDEAKYFAGNSIKLSIDQVPSILSIASITVVDGLVTITTNENLPDFGGNNRIELFYLDSPPPFSYLKAAHDRLYALGPGVVRHAYRDPYEALRFYYPYTTSEDANGFRFFNETTKTVPSFDISGKHGIADNLEAICTLNNYLVFMGRNRTQVWQGNDPINLQSANALQFSSVLPVGVSHGDLLVELPNDVYFISQNGCNSLSTLNVAKQAAASSFGAIDPLIRQFIKSMANSNYAYRYCRAFKYDAGVFCGFKIGFNDLLVCKYDTKLYAWSVFSEDFQKATAYTSDERSLFLGINDKIFQYADGNEDEVKYGDNDGNNPIDYAITWPIKSKRRWSNKRYEVQSEYSSSVVVNKKNYVNIVINGDLSKTFRLEGSYKFDFKGDLLGTVNLAQGLDVNSETPGMRLDEPYRFPNDRLHFLSSTFYLSIIGQTMDGPLSFKKIRLFGINER